jgi:hypothetical protein
MLHKYEIVVCFDPDVYVRHPNTSIEFLINRYNFTNITSLMMASDPNSKNNQDSKGRATLNMGFIIAQSNNLTKQVFRRLALCTETVPGCDRWKYSWSHEQRAFSEYFRDLLKVGSELIIAPCNELNGFEKSGSGCEGVFVTHVWSAKHTMKERLKGILLNNLMGALEQQMWDDKHVSNASTSDVKKLGIENDASSTVT